MWIATEVKRTMLDVNGINWTLPEVTHIEKREKWGALHMWILGWHKTKGVNRIARRDDETGRLYYPKEYSVAEYQSGGINWHGNMPYDDPQFSEEVWKEYLLSYVQSKVSEVMYFAETYRDRKLSDWDMTIRWGANTIDVYTKRSEWYQLYLRYVADHHKEWV